MEDTSGNGPEAVAASPAGANKSKLDTLSKDDLIKFAKKQMAAMQKLKGKCADLEKEVETLKHQPDSNKNSSEDALLIQELTERMDALLLEKAETQQSLTKCRKDLEKTKEQSKGEVAALQEELDRVLEDHQKKIQILENSIEESNNKHKEEVALFQKLLQEREELDRERESERERDRKAQESSEEARVVWRQTVQMQKSEDSNDWQESHQTELTKAQQEVENLREELSQRISQHEEEMRALEEDFEIERDRMLLMHEELTEQLALKESYLQDVQEEDEEPARGSGIAKMLELSRRIQNSSAHVDGEEEMEINKLREVLEDLQAQNTMLQDELTLLTNLKVELEAELERAREEFQTEREELEFKINELQMIKEGHPGESATTLDVCDQQPIVIVNSTEEDQNKAKLEEQQKINQDLMAKCEALTKERDSILAEYHQTRGVLQGFETELGEKTKEFVAQYNAMKEQGTIAIKELQDKIQQLSEERDELLAKVNEVTEEKNAVLENLQELKLKVEAFPNEQKKLQSTIEEQTVLASELRQSLEEVTRQKDDTISQVKERENVNEDLKIKVDELNKQCDSMQSQLQIQEEEMQKYQREKAKEIETLLQEKQEKSREIGNLQRTIEQLQAENNDLTQKLEEASSQLVRMEEEKKQSGSKMAELESEKSTLEAKLITLTEEASNVRETNIALEQNQSEVMRNSTEEIQELRMRIQELEMEREKLKTLQTHISGLEKEKTDLQSNIDEVMKDVEGLQKDLEDMKSINEKINEENQMLHAKVSLLSEEKEEHHTEGQAEGEYRDQLTEKDTLISQLRDEITALQSAPPSTSSENADSGLTEKIALLEKEHKDKDEKMNKIKAVAVKAKKELDISKKEVAALKGEIESLKAEREKVNSSMKDIIHGAEGYKNLQIDYDRQTEQLDKERAKTEAAERQIAELTRRLSAAVAQTEMLTSEKEDLLTAMETIRNTVQQLEAQNQDLQRQMSNLEREVVAERTLKEHKIKELSSASKEVEDLTAELHKQQQQSQQTAQELEQLRKEAQQSSLLDMEMADYERLVKELNGKLSEGEERVSELKSQINALNQNEETLKNEIESLKSQLDQGEEKTTKMKQLLVKTKKDLADAKKQESTLMMVQASLRGELEANQQQLEHSKIEMCELTAERHRLQEQLRSALEQHQRSSSSLQQRVSSLQTERDNAKAELEATAAEFESYKVRVHNVSSNRRTKLPPKVKESALSMQSSRKSVSDSQRKNPDITQTGLGFMALGDLQSMAREEGEGMEMTETESPSPASTPLPSLEQLLSSPDPKQEPFVWTVEPTKEELSQKLSTTTRSLDHISSLLHETEATNAVLMEQITLLKSEIRRLERNQEREKSVANLEYLKNVLLQFIFLRSGSERQALLPVIHTMLQLSPEEKSKLAAIAQGEEESSGVRGSGWSSYLHSWSGIR
ncbi:hypothetical protein WMY93_017523 [Mugilogobius chulae]|uniref:GRIP domain-containing protein n=1 Tax=Mugilogobius chulae TaxID=88201 RepID=A0AAW0P011_9GOBI